jgi:L-ascorbate metabolism protein UlaG (beta-lactamase superfamily)
MLRPRPYPVSDHCDGHRFFNPRVHINRSLREIWRWKRTSRPAPWPRRITFATVACPAAASGVRVTWLGHAMVLIQTPTTTFLTDPNYSPCAGPFGLLGPRRVHPPAIVWDDLPNIHRVLLSHDHYDHCDLPTLRRLARRFPHVEIITPLGNGALAARAGFPVTRIHEMDWWEEIDVPGWRLTSTPARHWSNRLSGRLNGRLWSGFSLRNERSNVYYAGDTGYDPDMFRDIARRLGPPDLAVLPIGAYEPRWFMAAQHCNPEEAVRIHQELGARRSFGVHWGTFQLTDEAREKPVEELLAARQAARVAEADFPVVLAGTTLEL